MFTTPESIIKQALALFLLLFLYPAHSFAADTQPPEGTIQINSNAVYTNTAKVSITNSVSDSGSGMGKGAKMKYSNDNKSWSKAKPYKKTKSWSLKAGSGTRTVYAKFRDAKGNWMKPAASDSIILDSSPPSKPLVSDSGSSTSSTSSLSASWSSKDSVSGLAEYRYQLTQGSKTGSVIVGWTSTGTTASVTQAGLSLTNGKSYYFGVKAKNGAGLWSEVGYSDGIKVDTEGADTTKPNITQVSPPDKSFLYQGTSQTLSITTDDFDSSPNYYQFSIDSTVKQSWSTKSSYSWDTSSSNLKKYSLKFEAKDDGGSSSQEAKVFLLKKPVSPPDD